MASSSNRVSDWRQLSDRQRRGLLELASDGSSTESPGEVLARTARRIAEIVGSKAAIVGRHGGSWKLVAESRELPPVPVPAAGAPSVLDRLGMDADRRVLPWQTGGHEWTLVALSSDPLVALVLEGNWISARDALAEAARRLASGAPARPDARAIADIAHRLTRALTETSGLAAVGECVLDHVVQAVPSRTASLAVATPEGELSIVATRGYPRALVEHLRIPSGSGVIGEVHRTCRPIVVPDATSLRRRRTRYRSDAFLVSPIVGGGEVLGVVSLTDRLDDGVYTQADASAVSLLMASAALALGRERIWREAQAYAQAAVIDPVSGLFNRRYFQGRLDEELQRAVRQAGSVALLMVDLDGFKGINDRYGHVAGDIVIRDISEILRRSVRIFDVCTRFGGEEFAVMMPGGTIESAANIAERVRQRVEAYQRTEPDLASLRVTASIGVAVSPPGASARDLIEQADRALYQSKRTGKNKVTIARPDGVERSA